jgi:anti-anti-sigma factor
MATPGGADDPIVSVSEHGTGLELRLSGELDIARAAELDAAVAGLEPAAYGEVVVDLTGARFIDSTVIAWLVGLANRIDAEGGHLRVVAGPGPVRRVLEVAGITRIVAVVDPGDTGAIPLPLLPPGAELRARRRPTSTLGRAPGRTGGSAS